MMTKIRFDLEKELEIVTKSKLNSKKTNQIAQQEDQLKSQIKHVDDQLRCVLFLLMQCQIGLENCNDSNNLKQSNIHQETENLEANQRVNLVPEIQVISPLE